MTIATTANHHRSCHIRNCSWTTTVGTEYTHKAATYNTNIPLRLANPSLSTQSSLIGTFILNRHNLRPQQVKGI